MSGEGRLEGRIKRIEEYEELIFIQITKNIFYSNFKLCYRPFKTIFLILVIILDFYIMTNKKQEYIRLGG